MAEYKFTPKFIPIYTDIRDKYNLSPTDAQTFGFIKFYVTSTGNQFFFGDNELMRILGYTKRVLYYSLNNLEAKNLIKTFTKSKSTGGRVRYIHLQDFKDKKAQVTKMLPLRLQNCYHIDNIVTENNSKVFLTETELFNILEGKSEDKLPLLPF